MTSEFQITRAAEPESLADFRLLVDSVCQHHPDIDDHTQYDLKLAIDEACTNVIVHGYEGMNPGSIILSLEFTGQRIVATITDFGHPFEPYEPEVPDVEASLEHGLSHGFGLFLIYQTMDEVDYHTAEDGNHLTFIKRLPASPHDRT
jgi:anti-sigma regulatory factor (Ser/Thr protein kinase)